LGKSSQRERRSSGRGAAQRQSNGQHNRVTSQVINFGDEGQAATRELGRRLEQLAARSPHLALEWVQRHVRTLEALDRQYGGLAPLPLEDVPQVVAAALTQLAHLERAAAQGASPEDGADVAHLTVGVALWAIRHQVPLTVVEPVANALALRSNHAARKEELAAVFGLMQGVIDHVAPSLSHDLERSNPERPWRILHANLAITAIRTEDAAMMEYAFDALDRALPDERASFYSQALALALAPGIAPVVRAAIEMRHSKWTRPVNS
jgi:hypothetical protein